MKDKSLRAIILQWILPFIVPLIVVCILLLQFFVTSRNKEYQEVEDTLTESAELYALQFKYELDILTNAAKTLTSLMEHYMDQDIDIAQKMMVSMLENTDADQVIMCNLAGEGMTHTGEYINIQSTDYFPDVTGSEQKYIYSSNGGNEGNSCIISAMPVNKEDEVRGVLLAYYNTTNFESMIKQMQSDMFDLYAVMDENGNIICGTGAAYGKYPKEDFWGNILKGKTNDKQLITANGRFNNNLSGIAKISIEQEEKSFIFVPLGINEWKMVLGMDYDYLKTMQNRELENARMMMRYLLICVVVYAAIFAVINIVMKLRDVEKNKVLVDRADTDLLTGLSNKVATEAKISAYLQEHSDEQALMFVFDVDDFKKINDTMGHAFGDEVLRTLGQKVRAEFRVSDVVGRIGGDEFMIFLKGMKDDDGVRKEAEKLERFFKNFRAGEYVKYSTTVSIGAAVYPRDAKDFEGLYKAADKALYKAKHRGKNQLAFYNEAFVKKTENK